MINSATYKPLTRVSSKENHSEYLHRKSLYTQKNENIVT